MTSSVVAPGFSFGAPAPEQSSIWYTVDFNEYPGDFIIECSDGVIHFIKKMLWNNSGYFKTKFESGVDDNTSDVTKLDAYPRNALNVVLNYLYFHGPLLRNYPLAATAKKYGVSIQLVVEIIDYLIIDGAAENLISEFADVDIAWQNADFVVEQKWYQIVRKMAAAEDIIERMKAAGCKPRNGAMIMSRVIELNPMDKSSNLIESWVLLNVDEHSAHVSQLVMGMMSTIFCTRYYTRNVLDSVVKLAIKYCSDEEIGKCTKKFYDYIDYTTKFAPAPTPAVAAAAAIRRKKIFSNN